MNNIQTLNSRPGCDLKEGNRRILIASKYADVTTMKISESINIAVSSTNMKGTRFQLFSAL